MRRLAKLLLIPVFAMTVVVHSRDSLARDKGPQGPRTFGKGTPFTVEDPSIRESHGKVFSTASRVLPTADLDPPRAARKPWSLQRNRAACFPQKNGSG